MAPIHKRFDEDESVIDEPAPEADIDASSEGEASDSDDGAPEAISATTALGAAKEAERRVAETLKQQADKERARRKQRDEKLAAQTKSRPKRQPREKQASEKEGDAEEDDEDEPTPLLPLDVLAAAERSAQQQQMAAFRAGTPESARKRKFIDADPKPAKDKRIGHTSVKVLAKAPSGLPPKSSKQTRNMRDSWLMGRRGTNTQAAGRRAQSTAFKVK